MDYSHSFYPLLNADAGNRDARLTLLLVVKKELVRIHISGICVSVFSGDYVIWPRLLPLLARRAADPL